MIHNEPSRTRGRDDKVLPNDNDVAESNKPPSSLSPSGQLGPPGSRPILHLKYAGKVSRPPG